LEHWRHAARCAARSTAQSSIFRRPPAASESLYLSLSRCRSAACGGRCGLPPANSRTWETRMLANIKILPRILIGFGILVLLIAGLSGFAIYSSHSSRTVFQEVTRLKSNEVLDQMVGKLVFEGRMQIWMALSTDDQEHSRKAEAAFQAAHQRLADLLAHTVSPQRLATVNQLGALLTTFEAKATKLKEFKGKNSALDTADGKVVLADALTAGGRVDEVATQLADAYAGAAATENRAATDQIAAIIDIAIVTGVVSVLLGVAMAVVMARSISTPIKAMTDAMSRLARREMATEFAGRGRKDEV